MSKLTIGEQIKKCRKNKGLTQNKLASLSGVSEISIRKYEAGDRHPKIEQIQKIFNAMDIGCPIKWDNRDRFI